MNTITAMKIIYPILSMSTFLAVIALYYRWKTKSVAEPVRIINIIFYLLDGITVVVLSLSVFNIAELDDTRIYIVTLRSIISVVALSIFYFVILEMYTQRKK